MIQYFVSTTISFVSTRKFCKVKKFKYIAKLDGQCKKNTDFIILDLLVHVPEANLFLHG